MTSDHTNQTPRGVFTILKLLYFFYFFGTGIYFTFANVYFRSIGMSGTENGWINTVAALTGIFSSILWGFINDRFGKTNWLMFLAISGSAITAMVMTQVLQFWQILPVVCLFSLFSSTIIPLLDTTTMTLLGSRRGNYGHYRMWGTIGFIISSFFAGPIFEQVGLVYLFPGYALAMLAMSFVAVRLPVRKVHVTGTLLSGLGQIVRTPAWLLFAASTLLVWTASSGMSNFLGVAIKMMDGPDRLTGYTWALGAATEIPFLLFSNVILRRIGAKRLIAASFVFYVLRIGLFGLMPDPNWAPYINLLHGPSFGFFWMAAVTYSSELAPDGLKSTAQGVFVSVTSLASMAGSLMSGYLLDIFGTSGMFGTLACLALAAGILFATGQFKFRTAQPQNLRNNP